MHIPLYIMQATKWVVVVFFTLMIFIQRYLFFFSDQGLSKSYLLLNIGIITTFLIRQKLLWFLGLCLLVYGIYDIIFIRIHASYPTVMDFTSYLRNLIYVTKTGSTGSWILQLIPVCFYPLAFIAFLTKPVRQFYHVSK